LDNVDREAKVNFFRSIHVLSVPTEYHESKGLSIIEALAAGVPVVQPRHGSFPEIVEATGGGLLYDPDDVDAYVAALAHLMDDAGLRERLGRQAREAVHRDFNDRVMAEKTWAIYEELASRRRGSS
jgi:glycosyltransferase involved in cell wall biosynthesis